MKETDPTPVCCGKNMAARHHQSRVQAGRITVVQSLRCPTCGRIGKRTLAPRPLGVHENATTPNA